MCQLASGVNDNSASVEFKSSGVHVQAPDTMPPTGTMVAQLAQQDAENLLNHLLKAIMGYPPNSEVKQALMSAGVGSVRHLLTVDGELFHELTFRVGSEER